MAASPSFFVESYMFFVEFSIDFCSNHLYNKGIGTRKSAHDSDFQNKKGDEP